jgi:purine-binding chemotaxis protein CheW
MQPALAPDRQPVLLFWLAGQRHGLALAHVERVVPAVEVTPLPGAPEAVLGAIDVAGEVLPVYSARRRVALPQAPVAPADQMVLAHTARRRVALLVDSVEGLGECELPPAPASGELESLRGVWRCDDGLLLIHDLDHFLAAGEDRQLEAALRQHA